MLLDLGIPLSVIALDEEIQRLDGADAGSRQLMKELQHRQPKLLEARRFGEAQTLAEHMQQLSVLGVEIGRVERNLEQSVSLGNHPEAQRFASQLKSLEEKRMNIAAIYETEFFFQALALPPGHEAATQEDHGVRANDRSSDEEDTLMPQDTLLIALEAERVMQGESSEVREAVEADGT